MSHSTDVLVVGGGPAGLVAALTLAANGVRCTLVERNNDTTKWPKMDLTNCRSMELLRRLGVGDEWRSIGVPDRYSLHVLFSTGLTNEGETYAKWELPSPDFWRSQILESSDGSQPLVPCQRGSQSLFESFLKAKLDSNDLVDVRYGTKFEKLHEMEDGVESHLTDASGSTLVITSAFVLGCDGGGSRVRRNLGIEHVGGPVPGARFLIHFKSKDIEILHRQGRFWHIFFSNGATLVSQDEVDTWTLHAPISLDADISQMDPYETIQKNIAGSFDVKVPLKVDEILVSSKWRPNIYLASKYTSEKRRVFLAGDSAHQTIPTGGYGMNTALGDSFDIGWKVAAVLKGCGGPNLLASYETERRPVASHNLEQAGRHWSVHHDHDKMVTEVGQEFHKQSEDGIRARERIGKFVIDNDFENKDFGTELDYRYRVSPVILRGHGESEPPWNRANYTPSTWPGMRAPSVRLADGKRNIYELFGTGLQFTIVDFSREGKFAAEFESEANRLDLPLKALHLPNEEHVRRVWRRDAVLVRPDDHVAWRCERDSATNVDAASILNMAFGRSSQAPNMQASSESGTERAPFAGTVGIVGRDQVSGMASFQG